MKSLLHGGKPAHRLVSAHACARDSRGLAEVFIDIRFDKVDVIPDPIGRPMVVVALGSLSRHNQAFGTAALAGLAGLVGTAVSIPEWFGADGQTLALVTALAESVLLFATCTGIPAIVPEERRRADKLRWWELGLAVPLLSVGLLAPNPADEGIKLLALSSWLRNWWSRFSS